MEPTSKNLGGGGNNRGVRSASLAKDRQRSPLKKGMGHERGENGLRQEQVVRISTLGTVAPTVHPEKKRPCSRGGGRTGDAGRMESRRQALTRLGLSRPEKGGNNSPSGKKVR